MGMKNMNQMMRQAKKLQENLAKTQEELRDRVVEGSAGGGAVRIAMNGHREAQAVTIDPEVVDKDDVETLQDLILAAISDALKQVDELTESELGKYTRGLNMPGLF